jgi:hypothetical protein
MISRALTAVAAAVFALATCSPVFASANDGWIEDDAPVSNIGASATATNSTASPDTNTPGTTSGAGIGGGANSTPLLKGQVTYCVPRGTPIKLKLATVPTFGMKSLQRDLDGKLVPARLNEEITAKTTEDIYVDDNKVIPQGTVFHGAVTKILPPRRVGRPGSLVLSFDSFHTPDGRTFKFRAEANNKKASTAKTKAKGFGLIMAHAAGGAIVGAIIAYDVCGLQYTIAMHGYNIAGAAAAGALAGTAVALMRHGPEAVLEPGDDLNMEIDTDLLIPAATSPTVKAPPANLPGLDIRVSKTKVIKDGLEGYLLKVFAEIENNSKNRLESIDLFVEDDNGTRHALEADVDAGSSDMLFTVEPYSRRHLVLDFQVDYPKLKHKLVWLDHKNRQVIYEAKLP